MYSCISILFAACCSQPNNYLSTNEIPYSEGEHLLPGEVSISSRTLLILCSTADNRLCASPHFFVTDCTVSDQHILAGSRNCNFQNSKQNEEVLGMCQQMR